MAETIYKELKFKGYSLKKINKILDLEFEYQKSMGLVSNPLNDTDFKPISLEYEPTLFIIERSNGEISKKEVKDVLDAENKILDKILG